MIKYVSTNCSITVAPPQDIKLFQKWTFKEITVNDIVFSVPKLDSNGCPTQHGFFRHEHQRFRKSKVNIVETL